MPEIEKKNNINNQILQVNKTVSNNRYYKYIVRYLNFLKFLWENWVRAYLVEHRKYTLCILIIHHHKGILLNA